MGVRALELDNQRLAFVVARHVGFRIDAWLSKDALPIHASADIVPTSRVIL